MPILSPLVVLLPRKQQPYHALQLSVLGWNAGLWSMEGSWDSGQKPEHILDIGWGFRLVEADFTSKYSFLCFWMCIWLMMHVLLAWKLHSYFLQFLGVTLEFQLLVLFRIPAWCPILGPRGVSESKVCTDLMSPVFSLPHFYVHCEQNLR